MNSHALADRALAAAADLRLPGQVSSATLLIQDETALPESLVLETDSYCNGWSLIRNAGSAELDRRVHEAGWQFFYLASGIHATVFGFRAHLAIRRAMKHLISQVSIGKYNCLQIENIRTGSFLGFPFVRVSARPRHIQQSQVLMPRDCKRSQIIRTASYV
jgi:hypothetical protein